MPKYFFDVQDNDDVTVDDVGQEFTNDLDVRNQAIACLPEMTIEELPDGPQHIFRVNVRDEGGEIIFTTSLELKSQWLRHATEERRPEDEPVVDEFPLA